VAWRFEHSAESEAEPHDVWRQYVDVEHWREWSQQGVEWSRIDGPFEAGTTGEMKSPGSPPVTFTLLAVEPDAFFTSEVKLPGARLRFEHVVVPSGRETRITHRVAVEGPLASAYTLLMRRRVKRGLLDGVERLAHMAAVGARSTAAQIGDALNPGRSR